MSEILEDRKTIDGSEAPLIIDNKATNEMIIEFDA